MRAIWNGGILADSDDIVMVEGNAYFPMATLDRSLAKDSATRSTCRWKGVANYFDIVVDGQVNKDAAWFYAEPKKGAEQVAGRVAFWKGVKVA